MLGSLVCRAGRGAGRVGFRLSFPATLGAVADALAHVDSRLGDMCVGPDLRGDVAIALGEVLNNVAEHACAGLAGARVTLRGGLSGQELWVEICDPGRPFPGGGLPAGQAVDLSLPVDALPEGGFGWFLIRSLTSGLEYRRQNGLNRLTLRFAP